MEEGDPNEANFPLNLSLQLSKILTEIPEILALSENTGLYDDITIHNFSRSDKRWLYIQQCTFPLNP